MQQFSITTLCYLPCMPLFANYVMIQGFPIPFVLLWWNVYCHINIYFLWIFCCPVYKCLQIKQYLSHFDHCVLSKAEVSRLALKISIHHFTCCTSIMWAWTECSAKQDRAGRWVPQVLPYMHATICKLRHDSGIPNSILKVTLLLWIRCLFFPQNSFSWEIFCCSVWPRVIIDLFMWFCDTHWESHWLSPWDKFSGLICLCESHWN